MVVKFSIYLNRRVFVMCKQKTKIVNSVDPDETAHLDPHCLQKYPSWSTRLKVFFFFFFFFFFSFKGPLDTPSRFSASSYKRDNFYDFLFVSPQTPFFS